MTRYAWSIIEQPTVPEQLLWQVLADIEDKRVEYVFQDWLERYPYQRGLNVQLLVQKREREGVFTPFARITVRCNEALVEMCCTRGLTFVPMPMLSRALTMAISAHLADFAVSAVAMGDGMYGMALFLRATVNRYTN